MNATSFLRGIIGAIIGAVLGYFVFGLLARQGFYAMVLPGALVGMGCGYLSGVRSWALGCASGLLAFAVSVFTEWKFGPFEIDDSFLFFITHLNELNNVKLIMIAVGTFFGFWFGVGRERWQQPPQEETDRGTE